MEKQRNEEKNGVMLCIEAEVQEKKNDLVIEEEMLLDAGIDPSDEIEIFCADGEVIIRQRSIVERLPEKLVEIFTELGIPEEEAEEAFQEAAWESGGFEKLMEELRNGFC